jgi:hypothetical protein
MVVAAHDVVIAAIAITATKRKTTQRCMPDSILTASKLADARQRYALLAIVNR